MVNLFSKLLNRFREDWAKTSLTYKTFLLGTTLIGNYLLWGVQYTEEIERYDETIYVYSDKKYIQNNPNEFPKYEWTIEECNANANLIPPDFEEDVATLEQELKELYPVDADGEKVTLDIVLDHSISWLTEDQRDELNKGRTIIAKEKKPYWHNHIIDNVNSLEIYKNYDIEFAVNSVTIMEGNICEFLAIQEDIHLFSDEVHNYVEQRNDHGADVNVFLMNYPISHRIYQGGYANGEVNAIGGDGFIAEIGSDIEEVQHTFAHEMGHLFGMIHPAGYYKTPGTHSHDFRSNKYFRIFIDPFFLLGIPESSYDRCNSHLMKWYTTELDICPKNRKLLLNNKDKFKD